MNIHTENKDALSLNLNIGGNSPDAKPSTVLAALDISVSVISSAPLPHFRWYFPPPDMMEQIVTYANRYGKPTQIPYFSIEGQSPVTAKQWSKMRAKWHHIHGMTNVWSEPAVRGKERLKNRQSKCLHGNQKPLRLIERIILATSDSGDVVWEPFGGMCSAAVVSLRKDRQCYSAEINPDYYQLAKARLEKESEQINSFLFPEFL